jgi:LemA protein
MSTILIVILGLIAFFVLYAIGVYNGLVKIKNRVDEAWSDIDVQLKRRFDLIPNLVETVKGYAAHEQETLENVIKARNEAMAGHDTGDVQKEQVAENALSATLKSLFALSENYPDLKANQNFLELQRELSDTEDKIMAARRFYNGNVRDYNIKLEIFPSNIIANLLKFIKKEFYEIGDEKQRENIRVGF